MWESYENIWVQTVSKDFWLWSSYHIQWTVCFKRLCVPLKKFPTWLIYASFVHVCVIRHERQHTTEIIYLFCSSQLNLLVSRNSFNFAYLDRKSRRETGSIDTHTKKKFFATCSDISRAQIYTPFWLSPTFQQCFLFWERYKTQTIP